MVETRLRKYWEQSVKNPGVTDLVEHHIDVRDAKPGRHPYRRLSPKMLEMANKELERLREMNIIEKSASDWCSAPVILRKSDD